MERKTDYQNIETSTLLETYRLVRLNCILLKPWIIPTEKMNHKNAASKVLSYLQFGHSKNFRPDILQFKQSLGTLDTAGIPSLSVTFNRNRVDDPRYLPAWRCSRVYNIGQPDFLH